MRPRLFVTICVTVLVPTTANAQSAVEAARSHVAGHRVEMVEELREFLTIPNVASDVANIQRNAAKLAAMMRARGVTTRVIETGGAPIVYGEIGDPTLPTILFYSHYDGQPADAVQWAQALEPGSPVGTAR